MIKVGEKFGNFLIKSEIGRGGMGTIYQAVDMMLNRDVALKIIHPQLTDNEQLMERFKIEAMTQARMNHPHIVMIFSFNRIENDYVIAMEYVKGQSLKELLVEKKRLEVDAAIFYVRQVLDGLKYAHNRHVIHRDIKPANILIDHDNQVKLSDFGVAKIFGSQGLTKTGILIGTPWYTPPEQILGREIDFRADLYSLGISFYEMLTGRVPFDSQTNSEFQIQKAHLETPPPRPSMFNPDIGLRLEKYILKALQKKVEKRFQNATEMLEELDKLERDIARATVALTSPQTRQKPAEPASGKRLFSPVRAVGFLILILSGVLLIGVLTGKFKGNRIKGTRLPPSSVSTTGQTLPSAAVSQHEISPSIRKPAGTPPAVESETISPSQNLKRETVRGNSQQAIPAGSSKLPAEGRTPVPLILLPERANRKEENAEPTTKAAAHTGMEKIEDSDALGVPIQTQREFMRLRNFMETGQLGKASRLSDRLLPMTSEAKLFQIIGRVRFLQNRFAEAEKLWAKSLAAGEWIDLGFVHRHAGGEAGCLGQLRFRSKLLIFDSKTSPTHSLALKSGDIESIRMEMEQDGIRLKASIHGRPLEETFTLLARNGRRAKELFLVGFLNKFIL